MILSRRPYKLLTAGALLALLTCGGALWLIIHEQERLYNAELTQQLLTEARMVREALGKDWANSRPDSIAGLVHALEENGVQVAVMGADGARHLGSAGIPDSVSLLATPEVERARRSGWGADIRGWGPEKRPHVIVAVRAGSDASTSGVVWLARPLWTMAEHPAALARLLGIVGGIVALVTLGLVVVFLRLRRRMFRRVIQTARNLSSGDLSTELDIAGEDELAVLSSSMNALRRRLASQVETIDRQRQMLQGLIHQLQEGVIVSRDDGRIALINPAAVRLLNLRAPEAGSAGLIDRPVERCIPQRSLHRLLLGHVPDERAPAEASTEPTDGLESDGSGMRMEIQTPGGTVHVLARAARLSLVEPDEPPGATATACVVLLTDITELQRTIQMRTDFVANASHELRTPLSTIRAAVETLLTMDLQADTPHAMSFLQKIDRHSARLQQMVSDLLDLSRLETPTERFEPEPLKVNEILQGLRTRFAEALERKPLDWQAACEPEDLDTITVNPHLLRLVLDNLVDNAIKFTDAGGHVGVRLQRTDDSVVFEVVDDGCGIPEDEQQRVFERFYQVQRSRSGPERGTGLGLSIVRHAVEAMNGAVRLESGSEGGTRVTVAIDQPKEVGRSGPEP